MGGIYVELPGVKLVVNRWSKHLDVTIHMRPQAGGQDGHCGNFNGDSTDDTVDLIQGRMDLNVAAADLLFTKANPFAGEAEPAARQLSDCMPAMRRKAEAQCRQALGTSASEQILDACISD